MQSNVDVLIELQRALEDSCWRVCPRLPSQADAEEHPRWLHLQTNGAHHFIIAVDWEAENFFILDTLGRSHCALANALEQVHLSEVVVRGLVPRQQGVVDCGDMCIGASRQIFLEEGIFANGLFQPPTTRSGRLQ